MGKPGFPMFTLGGVRPGNLQAGDAGTGGVGAGKPRPYAGPPPGRGCAPSRTLLHRGRAPGSSPQRGEAGRGGSTRRAMVTSAAHAGAPHHAAMNIAWERGRPARGAAPRARCRPPSRTLPHRGREPGSSPQRGEVRRGGSAPHTRR